MKFFLKKIYNKKNEGVAVLITILMVGGLLVEVALSGLLVIYFLNQSTFGARLSTEALLAARSGIEDATLRIIRNSNIAEYDKTEYTLDTNNRSARIIICMHMYSVNSPCDRWAPYSGNMITYEVTSYGTALNKNRVLRAFINQDSNTNVVNIENIEEINVGS